MHADQLHTLFFSQPGDPEPKATASSSSSAITSGQSSGLGLALYAIILVGGALAFGAYKYLEANSAEKVIVR